MLICNYLTINAPRASKISYSINSINSINREKKKEELRLSFSSHLKGRYRANVCSQYVLFFRSNSDNFSNNLG